jgi:hypothetical protein
MRESRIDTVSRIRLSALALSENGDAKNWYRASGLITQLQMLLLLFFE